MYGRCEGHRTQIGLGSQLASMATQHFCQGYRTLLSIDGGEWVPLPHSVILNIDRDVHTEAVQAALAKHKEWKMAVPMPSKRRSLVVQTSMDAYTPPGQRNLEPIKSQHLAPSFYQPLAITSQLPFLWICPFWTPVVRRIVQCMTFGVTFGADIFHV
ncbi:uncharacterized protein isoform X3 [Macaca fascicularis]|uniref:uncharacterized protein isoform X3 n=1 Tax=Macaca fascicularis TaxID=9541 RepID=UPI003D1536D9